MKYFYLLVVFLFLQCSNKEKSAIIKFEKEKLEFIDLEKGEKFHAEFIFHNVGDAPLKIENITADCGCTEILYDKEEIKPNLKGKISVVYDSKSDLGSILKTIAVRSNSNPRLHILYIEGTVLNPKN